MNAALLIIVATTLMALLLGLRAAQGRDMDLQQWSVGGRSFGTVFMFILLAGEIYTTFSFLGASGWAYGKGAGSYYLLAYQVLAYILSYFLLPKIWRYAQGKSILSQPHYFGTRFDSPTLRLLVAAVGVIALIPYLLLQFKGLGIIVSIASYGAISSSSAIWCGAAVATLYVIVSGMHGVVWNAVVKDVLILIVMLALGIYLPIHYYGNYEGMFNAIHAARPQFLLLPQQGLSPLWFQSTVLLSAAGFFMWPHTFGCVLTAKNDQSFRRNAVILPLYSLLILFALFVGFAAILQVPGLSGADADLALLKISVQTFNPWIVGVIGAAGLLTALVPSSLILTTAATIIANDIYRAGLARHASDATTRQVARWSVPVIALITVALSLSGGTTIVSLLLMGYNIVTQLFPALFFSLTFSRSAPHFVTRQGAFCGILAGVMTVAFITLTKSTIADLFPFLPSALNDVNVGLVALIVNFITMALVSLATRASHPAVSLTAKD